MTQGQIVRFKVPVTEHDFNTRMLVLEDRGSRMLVIDLDFVENPNWPIPPTSVYATSDLEIERTN